MGLDLYCLDGCQPAQVLTINVAINDFSNLHIYDINGNLYDNTCLEYSYSTDGANYSCWMKYDEIANKLFEYKSDYYIKVKVNGTIGSVKYFDENIEDYSTSLAKCFDFKSLKNSANRYNPYANMGYAMGLYQQLTETISATIGIPIYYFKLSPNINSKDITFKEYTLMDIESVKQIKMIVNENVMPSSKPEFSEFGFDFSTDWETEISKATFASAFGNTAKPMEGDLIYIPMMQRMWMVNGAYEEKNEGLMWNATTFKVALVKYQDKSSVDLKDTQSFVDCLVKTKYEDLFGDDENLQSNENTLESPQYAFTPLYPVFESDAIRKYVKHSSKDNPLKDINSKLISYNIYNKGILVADNFYDFRKITEESIITYQHKFIGVDGSISFIISLDKNYCKGTIASIGKIDINIDMTPTETYLSVLNLSSIKLESGKTYFIYIRWSKSKNKLDINAIEYTYPKDMPTYKVQKYHYKFDTNNIISVNSKYDIELEQCEKNDVSIYSFAGMITNIKVYDEYNENISELLQQYPTNQHLLINDTARKFVIIPGVSS